MSTSPEATRVFSLQPASNTDDTDHRAAILDIAASFIRALDYSPPPFDISTALKDAVLRELQSWEVGGTFSTLMKYLDVGLAAAEVGFMLYHVYQQSSSRTLKLFYPSHDFDLKVFMAVYTV